MHPDGAKGERRPRARPGRSPSRADWGTARSSSEGFAAPLPLPAPPARPLWPSRVPAGLGGLCRPSPAHARRRPRPRAAADGPLASAFSEAASVAATGAGPSSPSLAGVPVWPGGAQLAVRSSTGRSSIAQSQISRFTQSMQKEVSKVISSNLILLLGHFCDGPGPLQRDEIR